MGECCLSIATTVIKVIASQSHYNYYVIYSRTVIAVSIIDGVLDDVLQVGCLFVYCCLVEYKNISSSIFNVRSAAIQNGSHVEK